MLNNDASRDNADFAPGDLSDARLEFTSLLQGNGSCWYATMERVGELGVSDARNLNRSKVVRGRNVTSPLKCFSATGPVARSGDSS
jgi:hypothetical protein